MWTVSSLVTESQFSFFFKVHLFLRRLLSVVIPVFLSVYVFNTIQKLCCEVCSVFELMGVLALDIGSVALVFVFTPCGRFSPFPSFPALEDCCWEVWRPFVPENTLFPQPWEHLAEHRLATAVTESSLWFGEALAGSRLSLQNSPGHIAL